jgi:hypothetical protein
MTSNVCTHDRDDFILFSDEPRDLLCPWCEIRKLRQQVFTACFERDQLKIKHPALRAGDELAHQSVYTPSHERWWQARGGHDKCTVCCVQVTKEDAPKALNERVENPHPDHERFERWVQEKHRDWWPNSDGNGSRWHRSGFYINSRLNAMWLAWLEAKR